MDYDNIRIKLEKDIGEHLFDTLEGEVLEGVLKEAKVSETENDWKYLLEGHSFKVSSTLTPRLNSLFNEVKKKLHFEADVDFYITNSKDLNAFAISGLDDSAHIININSATIETMDDDELKFIIGHEIGHLISNNAKISRHISFVFPDYDRIPLLLKHKIELWEKLAELTADRFGFIASPDLKKCISGFFKLSSGLDTNKIKFNYEAYLLENDNVLKFFKEKGGNNLTTHPVNPIRIKAIELFSKSKLYNSIESDLSVKEDSVLDKSISELVDILTTLSNSEIDYHRKYFIAAGGLIVANADGKINQEEYDNILRILSNLSVFPVSFLDFIIKGKETENIFIQSMQKIMSLNPSERRPMLEYLISIAMADHELLLKEISFIFEIGQQKMGFSRKEVAQIIADNVHQSFTPKLY